MNQYNIYKKIMRNISKEIKRILNEDIQRFDTSDYRDDEQNLISDHEIDNFIDPVTDLLTKVLSGNYNACDFDYNEIRLWNEKIAGTLIDENGTIAIKIHPSDMTPCFVAQLVDVNDIREFNEGWVTVRGNSITPSPDDEGEARVLGTDDIRKNTIIEVSKNIKGKGNLPIICRDEIFALIDTDYGGITFDSIAAALSFGFNKSEIDSNNKLIINNYIRNLIIANDNDLSGFDKYHDIRYIWVGSCKYNKNNIH